MRALKKKPRFYLFILINLFFTAGLIAMYHFFINDPSSRFQSEVKKKATQVAENEILFSERFNRVFKSSSPTNFNTAADIGRKAVVFIRSDEKITSGQEPALSLNFGSGVIISNNGYIVTNYHVIGDGHRIEVTLNDNRVFSAK